MAITEDWKIRSRARECCQTQRPFEDGEAFYTAIFPDPESDGYLRRDYSLAAWEELRQAFSPPPFSYWRSTFKIPPPQPEKAEVMEKHSAEATLRRLIDEDDPATIHARYILALMLERKRTLVQVNAHEVGETRLLFYEHKATGDAFIIADPRLKLDEIERIQMDVVDLLSGSTTAREEEAAERSGEALETAEGEETAAATEQPQA